MMKKEEKVEQVYKWVIGLNNQAAYCEDLSDHLYEMGFKKVEGFSINTNWIYKKRLHTLELIKINEIYEFTKNYPSNAGSKTKEKTEHGTVVQ